EPKVALTVLHGMLAKYISNGQLTLLLDHKAVNAQAGERSVETLTLECLKSKRTSKVQADYFIDATELGDLLPITGTEYVIGTESKNETREIHAPLKADPTNQQAFTMCFALEYIEGEDFVERPVDYEFWRDYVPHI